MTKRDNTAVKVLHDSHESSRSEARESIAGPIGSVSCVDEPAQAESAAVCSEPALSNASVIVAEDGADKGSAPPTADAAPFSALTNLPDAADGRGARPTLMGLAPLELDASRAAAGAALSAECDADAGLRADEQAASEPETSTVRPTRLLALAQDDARSDEPLADNVEPEPAPSEAQDPAQGDPPAVSGANAEPDSAVRHASSVVAQPVAADFTPNNESPQASEASVSATGAPVQVPIALSLEQPRSDQAHQDSESEWLDLSTRWLVTTGPQPNLPPADDNEVTDLAHWADRLSARVGVRADSRSSAPPPPPPLMAAQPSRRGTMAYGRPDQMNRHANAAAPGAQAGFDAAGQRPWNRDARRHATLAGISPLPQERGSLPTWPNPAEAHDHHAGDSEGEAPNPWREEPSYSDAPQPQSHGAGSAAAAYAAPAGTLPPWAATMSPYAMPPEGAMVPPYGAASWNGAPPPSAAMMPPWAATMNYGVPLPHAQYFPPVGYGPGERTSRSSRYASSERTRGARHSRTPQQRTIESELEPWKRIANTWFATLAKCGVAVMALHYSGLAVPVLAYFGYAPAARPASASANESAVQSAAPVAANLAASSVIPDGLSPAFAERSAAASSQRRRSPKRETEAGRQRHAQASAREAGSPSNTASRRHGSKSVHKQKPTPSSRAKAAPAIADLAPTDPQAQPSASVVPLVAPVPPDAEPASEAFLRINSRPWSQVFIDGTHVGHTPKLDLRVSPGAHRVRLVNPDLGVSKTFELSAAAGETVSHVELFAE